MKRSLWLSLIVSLVAFRAAPAGAQQPLINCAPGVACNSVTGPANTGTGDPAWRAFGKVNSLVNAINTATFYPATPVTQTTIAAAASACNAAGGGTIKIPNVTVTLTSTLPLYNGCTYEGTGWGFNQAIVAEGGTFASAITGTIIQGNGTGAGDGTFDCFGFNNTDQHSTAPTNTLTFVSGALKGGGIRNLTIQFCAYGIHVGDYWNVGWQTPLIEHVTTVLNNWGIWLENSQFGQISHVVTMGNWSGQFAYGASQATGQTGGSFNFGNTHIENLQTERIGVTRGTQVVQSVLFFMRGSAGSLNSISTLNLLSESNTTGTTTQTATLNGTTSIGVTDLSKWQVNLPVFFSGSPSGVTANQVYYITSVSGTSGSGTVTVGSYPIDFFTSNNGNTYTPNLNAHANDLSPSGSGSLNTMGFEHLQFEGLNTTTLQPGWMQQTDLEGGATTAITFSDVQAGYMLEGGYVGLGTHNTDFLQMVSYHNQTGNTILFGFGFDANYVYTDQDSSVGGGNQVFGPRTSNYSGPVTGSTRQPMGMSLVTSDASGRLQTSSPYSMGFFMDNGAVSMAENKNGFIEFPEYPLGMASVAFVSGTTIHFEGFATRTNHWTYVGGGAGTCTFDQIPANGEGVFLFMVNATAFNLTCSTTASQKILHNDGTSGSTSIVFPPFSGSIMMASYNNNGTGTATNYFFDMVSLPSGSQAEQTIDFQPGLVAAVTNGKGAFSKFLKASTVDNIEVSASAFTCSVNPAVTLYECGTSTTCASPTTIGSATITAASTVVDGTVSNAAITAGDYVAWAVSAGTCSSLDIAGTAQVHTN